MHPALGEASAVPASCAPPASRYKLVRGAPARPAPTRRRRGGPRPGRARHRLRHGAARAARTGASCARACRRSRAPRRPGLRALMRVAALDPADARRARARLPARAADQRRGADAAAPTPRSSCCSPSDDGARRRGRARARPAQPRPPGDRDAHPVRRPRPPARTRRSEAAIVVAGEGWHPGVVGIVASRLVERCRRPVRGDRARRRRPGAARARSISAYDLHAGLAACADAPRALRRPPRWPPGVEIDRGGRRAVPPGPGGPRRRARSAPHDLCRCERVDAVVPGGALGLELAEELERLRPFGAGNPQPDAARAGGAARARAGDGRGAPARPLHARDAAAPGTRGRVPDLAARARAPARASRTTWRCASSATAGTARSSRGAPARALPSRRSGLLSPLGEDGSFWERLERRAGASPPVDVPAAPAARRCGPARRGLRGRGGRPALERRARARGRGGRSAPPAAPSRRCVAGLGRGRAGRRLLGCAGAPPGRWPRRSRTCSRSTRPRAGARGPAAAPRRRLAHRGLGAGRGGVRARVWRAELELRPALTDVYRALRAGRRATPRAGAARRGRYPRGRELCAPHRARARRAGRWPSSTAGAQPGASSRAPAPSSSARRRSAPTASASPRSSGALARAATLRLREQDALARAYLGRCALPAPRRPPWAAPARVR